jgi:DinB superfamily
MNVPWKTIVWSQFGASIDTLEDMLSACPEALWRERLWENTSARPEYAEVWYRVYHALFWLDLYLTGAEEGFVPPAPFELIEMEENQLPERVYTKDELQAYLEYGRQKCEATIEALTDETAQRQCQFAWGTVSFAELLLYNLRHVQEIAAQLSLFLGQKGVSVPDSVPIARNNAA